MTSNIALLIKTDLESNTKCIQKYTINACVYICIQTTFFVVFYNRNELFAHKSKNAII